MRRGKAMTGCVEDGAGRRGSKWRFALWGAAALLLSLPLLAMTVTDQVRWGLADFVVFAAMLAAAGGGWELAARRTVDGAYRAAVGVALASAFVLVWMNLAVGVIGAEDNPANLMYGGVLAVGFVGAAVARFRPRGMARALAATALAQASVAAIALLAWTHPSPIGSPAEILGLNGVFVALFLGSAWLFGKAARGRTPAGRGAAV